MADDAIELTARTAGGMTFIAQANSGHWTVMDATEAVGGHEGAMHPFEHLFAALAGCTGVDVLYVLKKKRIPVDDMQVNVKAKRRDKHPRIATDIHIHFTVIGPDIPPEAVERAITLSQEKYCSVTGQIRETANITTSYEILTLEEARGRDNL